MVRTSIPGLRSTPAVPSSRPTERPVNRYFCAGRPCLQSFGSRQLGRLDSPRPLRPTRPRHGRIRGWCDSPYSHLIGGKLVAALMTSQEVKRAYERKYLGSESVIRKKKHRARLVLLTTTSALGRSSIYNRLSLPGGPRFLRIGTTRGFGHFHLSGEIFEALRGHLEATGHPYASGHRFGMGPNWKLRVVRAALEGIGIDGNSILKHGIEREVYAIPLAQNWQKILLGSNKNVRSLSLPASEIADFCLNRWMVPRARRDERFKDFDPESIMRSLLNEGPGAPW